jgi:hypothetical protein
MDAKFFERKVPNYVLLILFFLGLAFLKAALSLKFPSPSIVADEVVYSETASNILSGIFFSKLQYCQTYPPGYPLVLSPAYLISNNESTTYHIMLLINCLLTSSIIFPAFFILKPYTSRTIAFLVSILISVLPSVSLYTFFILSENLFIPLFAFSFWFLMESYKGRGKSWDFLAGFSIFFLVLTKTTGIAMIIGFLASLFFYSRSRSSFTKWVYILKGRYFLLASFLIPFLIWNMYKHFLIPVGIGEYNVKNYLVAFIYSFDSFQDFCLLISFFIHEVEFVILASYFAIFAALLYIISFSEIKKLQISFPELKWNSLGELNEIALKSSLVYFLVSSIFLITITVAHMLTFLGNPEYLIFGRYVDPIVPLVFLISLGGIELFNNARVRVRSELIITMCMLTDILFVLTFPYESYKFPNMFSIYYIYGIKNIMPIYVVISLFLLLFCISSYIYIKNIRARPPIIILFVLFSIFLSSYTFNIEVRQSLSADGISPIGKYLDQNCNKNTTIFMDDTLHLPNKDPTMWFETQFWTRGRLNITLTTENLSNIGTYHSGSCYLISSKILSLKPLAYSNPDYNLYLLSPERPEIWYIINNGFYDIENWSGTPTRWMQADATLLVYSYENRTVTLNLSAQSFYRNRMLEITSGNAPAVQFVVPTNFVNVSMPIYLTKGANTIHLHVPEGCDRPGDKPEMNNPDSRCLSVAAQNLTVI